MSASWFALAIDVHARSVGAALNFLIIEGSGSYDSVIRRHLGALCLVGRLAENFLNSHVSLLQRQLAIGRRRIVCREDDSPL